MTMIVAPSMNVQGREITAAICDECIPVCVQVIATRHPEWLEQHRQFVASLGS
ncbi:MULTISPECIES: hypothetical protein [unclassified Bradyrhizobium]